MAKKTQSTPAPQWKAVDLGGVEWQFAFVSAEDVSIVTGDTETLGVCEDHRYSESPKIMVTDSLKGRKRLNTTLHELLHAADIFKTEQWVEQTANEIERILTEDGWVRK